MIMNARLMMAIDHSLKPALDNNDHHDDDE